ncbi:glycosyltransferase family 1 protein [Kosakonia sp.]|uniref:glycosyltransferase family 4 protein n=1 Tax=Kosakonia sp. TaxID=1916651 RepID=UPI0028ACE1B4|nr:glycosyltransferase family 1 protein [Kosakonia sp.]
MIVNLSRLGKHGTGMWQYSLKFLDALASRKKISAIICADYHRAGLEKYNSDFIIIPSIVGNTSRISRLRPVFWLLYSYWLGWKIKRKYPEEVIVSTTHHALPLVRNQVITVHDLRPCNYPDSIMQKIYFNHILPREVKKCIGILTVSETVKKRICSNFGLPLENVSVIYNAIDKSEFEYSEKKDNFLLAVGASWFHKNIHTLLNAHTVWKDTYKLKIVCGRTQYVDFLKSLVAQLGLTDNVEFLHELPFATLKKLYSQAAALVYPSLDEGFGIPPVEAMASGTLAIVADIPVFKEILGESAIYVNPLSHQSWSKAIQAINYNENVQNKMKGIAVKYSVTNMDKMVNHWLEGICK